MRIKKYLEKLDINTGTRIQVYVDKIIDKITDKINSSVNEILSHVVNKKYDEIEQCKRIIDRQTQTINQLVNALCDKYKEGLFVFSDHGEHPLVIRDGKEITNEMTKYFAISWDVGETPYIEIQQMAETYDELREAESKMKGLYRE